MDETAPGEEVKEAAKPEKETYEVSRDVAGTLRKIDPETGEVELYTSIDGILQAVPKMNWDLAATWSRLPIMKVHLFIDRATYARGGMERSYASKVFQPQGLDLISAIQWWRKRVPITPPGTASAAARHVAFAVFEGSFTAEVSTTDPPVLMLDALGEVEADDVAVIQRKHQSHVKRRALEKRWASEGTSEDVLKKIKEADLHSKSRKAKGDEYLYKTGWVPKAVMPGAKSPRRLMLPMLRARTTEAPS